MILTRELSKSGDPSERQQSFKKLDFNILCCRYWWLGYWKGQKMSFPYWRLYWNKNEGAYIYFNGKHFLTPDKIYLISPHTPFDNGIVGQKIKGNPTYLFKSGKIKTQQDETERLIAGEILHFFVHFKLGHNLDQVKPGVYEIPMNNDRQLYLNQLIEFHFEGTQEFPLDQSFLLYQLILSCITYLPKDIWQHKVLDRRVQKALIYLEENLDLKLTDNNIADAIGMKGSSFVRLFKEHVGKSPSKYLVELRLNRASDLLLYSDKTLDKIANECGFYDRYYMSRLFSKHYKIGPAAFRKRLDL